MDTNNQRRKKYKATITIDAGTNITPNDARGDFILLVYDNEEKCYYKTTSKAIVKAAEEKAYARAKAEFDEAKAEFEERIESLLRQVSELKEEQDEFIEDMSKDMKTVLALVKKED